MTASGHICIIEHHSSPVLLNTVVAVGAQSAISKIDRQRIRHGRVENPRGGVVLWNCELCDFTNRRQAGAMRSSALRAHLPALLRPLVRSPLCHSLPASPIRRRSSCHQAHARSFVAASVSRHSSELPLANMSFQSLFSTERLNDKVVLITGASAGIGRATAILFARAGANVILTARRKEKLAEAVKECQEANKQGATGKGGKYAAIELDVQKKEDVDALLGKLPDWAKEVDILGTLALRGKSGDIQLTPLSLLLKR